MPSLYVQKLKAKFENPRDVLLAILRGYYFPCV